MKSSFSHRFIPVIALLLLNGILLPTGVAAPKAKIIEFWLSSNEASQAKINHDPWQILLDRYLDTEHPSGINRFNYGAVSPHDKQLLDSYISDMQALDPRQYSRKVQKSYWINLYNAATVKLVLDKYPVKSITKIGRGFFSFGPWDDKIFHIQAQNLSLNDIEHGILRPIWKDNRIHYAVNCASLGCPNLQPQAYTATTTEELLEKAAKEYINHPRGVHFNNNHLTLSSIYDWYRQDFGDTDANIINHLKSYAGAELKQQLEQYTGDITFDYNWQLNDK